MKRIILSLVITTAIFSAKAQKITLSVNGGAALPMGGFGKGDYYDASSGFAGTGGHFNVTAGYSLGKHWGVQVLAGYSKFAFKGAQSLSDGYKEDSGTDSTTLYRKGTNHSWSFLIGPTYKIDAGRKFSITARALGGYVNTHLAGFQIFYEDYLDNAMSQREASGSAFGWQAGLGLQYKLTPHLAVQINADYFACKPNITIAYDNFVVNSGRRLEHYNQTIGGINATAGLALSL